MDTDVSKRAIQYYGKPNQVLKLIEELHELSEVLQLMLIGGSVSDTSEIHAMTRRTRANLDAIKRINPKLADMDSETAFRAADEFADSIIMIMQGIDIFECEDLTQKRIFFKESRLLDRIEGNDKP